MPGPPKVPGESPGGTEATQCARREPVPAEAEPEVWVDKRTEQQVWEDSSFCMTLNDVYPRQIFQTATLASYVYPPETDLTYIKDNTVEWMKLGVTLGKTVCSHFSWTDRLAALDFGGPTPFVFQNLAKVIGLYPGLQHCAQALTGAVEDRVRAINVRAIDQLARHAHQANLHVFSDSTLNFGKSRRGHTHTPLSMSLHSSACSTI